MPKLSAAELEQANNLTTREKIALLLLLAIFRVLKPTDWAHQMDAQLDQVNDLIKGGK